MERNYGYWLTTHSFETKTQSNSHADASKWRELYKVAPPLTELVGSAPISDVEAMDGLRQLVSRGDFKTVYSIQRKLGQGCAAEITTGRRVVITRNDMSSRLKHLFLNQLSVMKELDHPNIISFVGSYLIEPEELWIVTDHIEGGELTHIIRNHKIAEDQISNICTQICKGLAYVHSHEIIHRDIRPGNVLVDMLGRVKIKGFGFCAKLTEKRPRPAWMAATPKETQPWMAPEVVKQEQYGVKVDIWSLGILVIELTGIDNGPPYMDEELLTFLYQIAANGTPTLKKPEGLSPELKDFLALCLCVDVERRASAVELLDLPFMQKACDIARLAPLLSQFRKERLQYVFEKRVE
ncbi:kinase-like domain-containing protein [Mycena capillaripes]|nr:kinase-like domain-containing protein [Mycena capillaripes]